MMKRLIVVGVLLLGLATAASAVVDTAWILQLRTSDPNNGAAATAGQFGAAATASGAKVTIASTQVGIICPDRGETPPDWYKDLRVIPATATENVVWNLIVRAGSAYASTKFKLSAWNPTGTAYDIDNTIGDLPKASKVKLFKDGVEQFTWDPTKNGTSAAPIWTKEYDIAAGQEVSGFQLVYEIPEPGSMIALMSGLVGLAGFAIRRRK